MENNIISALRAHEMSDAIKQTIKDSQINDIFERGIRPAIQEGKFECTVKNKDNNIYPVYIIQQLEDLGYDVKYYSYSHQWQGEIEDRTQLIIKW